MGLLERHLDADLIARIESSGPIKKPARKPPKNKPRHASTYRGAIRNARRAHRAEQLAIKRAALAASANRLS